MSISPDKIREIEDFLSKCKKIKLNIDSPTDIFCYYYQKSNFYIIVVKTNEESYFLQHIGNLNNIILKELNSYYPSVDKEKIFICDYSGSYIQDYDIVNINTSVDTFTNKDINNYKDFKLFIDKFAKD